MRDHRLAAIRGLPVDVKATCTDMLLDRAPLRKITNFLARHACGVLSGLGYFELRAHVVALQQSLDRARLELVASGIELDKDIERKVITMKCVEELEEQQTIMPRFRPNSVRSSYLHLQWHLVRKLEEVAETPDASVADVVKLARTIKGVIDGVVRSEHLELARRRAPAEQFPDFDAIDLQEKSSKQAAKVTTDEVPSDTKRALMAVLTSEAVKHDVKLSDLLCEMLRKEQPCPTKAPPSEVPDAAGTANSETSE
jgi:hypothetical protein